MPHPEQDLFCQTPDLKKNRHIYTVSQINQDIKLILENTFGEVWVEGEVSGLSRIATGTVFFALKDNLSLLKCVMFFNYAAGAKFELKDGMQVLCFGKVSVYEKEGKYQLYVQGVCS
jgi:exodeoxyribonuclease VII large subunit